MKTIDAQTVTDAVAKLCIDACVHLNCDVRSALEDGLHTEESPVGKDLLEKIIENAAIAAKEEMPICQDTGMAIFFVEVGQDVHINGNLTNAINEGVRKGYEEGCLRKSVVADPLRRVNTGDNTPAIIHYDLVDGDGLTITIAPKGFGSENMSRLGMLKPSDGENGVKDFIVETVSLAGANPCPPVVLGVGIGGSMEQAALLAKKALTQDIASPNPDPYYRAMEEEVLERINRLGIGPQGLGGRTTCLGVNILPYPTHIAGLPVAVNVSCHVTRHKTIRL